MSAGAIGQIRRTVRDSGPLWAASLVLDRLAPFGVLGLWPDRRVSPDLVAGQVEAILRKWGMSAPHASITVDHLLYADLRGIDSHGCGMLLHYQRALAQGSLCISPEITVVRESETTALVDGGGGLGQVPADTAMKVAIAKCRDTGVGAVAARNSGHFGAAGAYASMAARSGFIGISTTTTAVPAVVPTFGTEAKLGTNPIAFCAPARRNQPFLLDMATSTVPVGRIAMEWRRGHSIPAGWALDPRGKPVRRARRALEHRRLTPLGATAEMGSHKGYGLATAVEILSLLSGLGPLQGSRSADAAVGHLFLAIDPDRFREDGGFEDDVDDLIDSLRACEPIDPKQPVLVAGDPEHAAEQEHRRQGIPLSRGVVEDIRSVARACGAPFILDASR